MESMSFEGRREGADCTRGGILLSKGASMPRSPPPAPPWAGRTLGGCVATMMAAVVPLSNL